MKLEYMEDVNSLSSKLTESVERELLLYLGEDFKLKEGDEDKIWDFFADMFSEYSKSIDYKNHN
jgi:hypothetical protein